MMPFRFDQHSAAQESRDLALRRAAPERFAQVDLVVPEEAQAQTADELVSSRVRAG